MASTVSFGNLTVAIPSHQAQLKAKNVPKISYLPIRSGNSNGVWRSSGTFLDFELPSNVGILKNVRLRFSVNNTDASAQAVPPTPFWVDHIEVSIGTTQIESLYPNDIFNETVGFMSNDETYAKNEVLAVNSPTVPWGYQAPVGAGTYYLPFNNCLTTSRLYVAGCDKVVKYRVYFPPNMFPSTFTMTSVLLEILEDVPVNNDETMRLSQAMRTGMVYNTVVRQRQQVSITKSDTNSNMTIDLTGITGKSAGLVVYANTSVVPASGTVTDPTDPSGAPVPANAQLGFRYNITTLELNDQMGRKRTEQLQGAAQNSFVWWDQVGTEFASNDKGSTYLIPNANHFKTTVLEGHNTGFLSFDGTDRLVLTAPFAKVVGPPPSSESWVVTVTNYAYNQLVFQNNDLTQVVTK